MSKLSVAAGISMSLVAAFSGCASNKVQPGFVTENQADPWIYYHTDGFYYYTATYCDFDRLVMRKAKSIEELKDAQEVTVGKANEGWLSGIHSYIWAPELHFIEGSWYLFFTASTDSQNVWQVRSHVAKCSGENPLEDEWTLLGKIKGTLPGKTEDVMTTFNLDGTAFKCGEQWYYTWAQYVYCDGWADEVKGDSLMTINGKTYLNGANGNGWSCIFIGKTSPEDFTKVTDAAIISVPEYGWENGTKVYDFNGEDYVHHSGNVNVNEGPAVLVRNGKVFIAYSASSCDEAYCLGLLSADENADLCRMESWQKSKEPVFTTSVKNGIYGPGHVSFTKSKSGEDLIVYHARNYYGLYSDADLKVQINDGLRDPHRSARVKKFTWKKDGFPEFGEAE